MKNAIKLIICLIIGLCFIQAAAASNYEVNTIKVTPSSGDLSPGQTVSVECYITLASSGEWTFPDDHELEAYTELNDPKWEYMMLKNDLNLYDNWKTSGKRYLTFTGWDLAYPDSDTIKIKYRLEGKVPTVTASTDKIIFRLDQKDSNGNLVSNGEFIRERKVLNPQDIETTRKQLKSDLAKFRTSIDEKTATGVNTARAEEKYGEAEDFLDESESSSYATANEKLTKASEAIEAGNVILEQEWADTGITDAQLSLDETEKLLVYFKDNRSMNSDARVLNIETKYNIASQELGYAKNFREKNDNSNARYHAEQARIKGEEALSEAKKLRSDIGDGLVSNLGNIGGYLLIFGVVIVFLIIAIVFYRRYTGWDELG